MQQAHGNLLQVQLFAMQTAGLAQQVNRLSRNSLSATVTICCSTAIHVSLASTILVQTVPSLNGESQIFEHMCDWHAQLCTGLPVPVQWYIIPLCHTLTQQQMHAIKVSTLVFGVSLLGVHMMCRSWTSIAWSVLLLCMKHKRVCTHPMSVWLALHDVLR